MAERFARLGRDVVVGVRAALRAPRVIDSSLQELLDLDARGRAREVAPIAPIACERAIRVSHAALRMLARLPGGRWRNTCLFRSVAECVVARENGWPARVAIGVGRPSDDVVAHAWVEMAGREAAPSELEPLRAARAGIAGG